jgi:NAD(P)-dependent dehydrogenase (short-subunit alcohol dehydrogenase family)
MGLETARQLLARGLRVAMTGRDERDTDRARRALGDRAQHAMAVRLDVTDVASIRAAYDAIVERFGAVDVLVNNAAVLNFEASDVFAIPRDGYHSTFEANLFGVIEVCRVFVPPMADRRYGRIVNVSSGAGQLSRMSTYAPAYSMSKAALNAFTRILAHTTEVRAFSRMPSIPDGSAPTWADHPRRDRSSRASTPLSGSPRFPMTVRQGAFSGTAALRTIWAVA